MTMPRAISQPGQYADWPTDDAPPYGWTPPYPSSRYPPTTGGGDDGTANAETRLPAPTNSRCCPAAGVVKCCGVAGSESCVTTVPLASIPKTVLPPNILTVQSRPPANIGAEPPESVYHTR